MIKYKPLKTLKDYTQTSIYQSAPELFKDKALTRLKAIQPHATFRFEGYNLRFKNILTNSELKSGLLQQHHELKPGMIEIWDTVLAEVTSIVRKGKISIILAL
ncbi:hypothetical protein [Pontibacter kalidii]|uniref:hypothetical protein n=1 Tax=Pontibacter kalidii TaxID=2592049 RepID=UPI00224CF880|nr:hypothetical protein [Pontibacter kalidii]